MIGASSFLGGQLMSWFAMTVFSGITFLCTAQEQAKLTPVQQEFILQYRDALLDKTRKAVEAIPRYPAEIRMHDDSPRIEVPEFPPEGTGEVRTYLQRTSLFITLKSLERIRVAYAEGGLQLVLDYRTDSVTILDRGDEDDPKILTEFLEEGQGLESGLFQQVLAKVRSWADTKGINEKEVDGQLEGLRKNLERLDLRYREIFKTANGFRRAALWAGWEKPKKTTNLYLTYVGCRLLIAKAAVVRSAGGPEKLKPHLVISGPVHGIRRGEPGKDMQVHAFMQRSSKVYVEFQIRSRDGGQAVSFTPEQVDRILASLRPFEGRRSEAASFTRRAEAVEKSDEPGKEKKAVLWRLAAFRLLPDAGNAEALLRALRTQPEPPAGAELKRLAGDIAERINSSAPEKERLLKAAKGS
jgi:hypothetical protein